MQRNQAGSPPPKSWKCYQPASPGCVKGGRTLLCRVKADSCVIVTNVYELGAHRPEVGVAAGQKVLRDSLRLQRRLNLVLRLVRWHWHQVQTGAVFEAVFRDVTIAQHPSSENKPLERTGDPSCFSHFCLDIGNKCLQTNIASALSQPRSNI